MRRRDYLSDFDIEHLRGQVAAGDFVRPIAVGRLGLELHVTSDQVTWAATFVGAHGEPDLHVLGHWPDLDDPHAALETLRGKLFPDHSGQPADLANLLIRYDLEQLAARSSRRPTLRSLRKALAPWLNLPLADLDSEIGETVASDLARLANTSPAQADRVRHSLCAFFRWAEQAGWCEDHVTGHLPSSPRAWPTGELRVLTLCDIADIWTACEQLKFPYGGAMRFLIAAPVRMQDIRAMRWTDVDLIDDPPLWRPSVTSLYTQEPLVIPLFRRAAFCLAQARASGSSQAGCVFSRTGQIEQNLWTAAKRDLDDILDRLRRRQGEAGFGDWQLRDIHRTFRSWARGERGVDEANYGLNLRDRTASSHFCARSSIEIELAYEALLSSWNDALSEAVHEREFVVRVA